MKRHDKRPTYQDRITLPWRVLFADIPAARPPYPSCSWSTKMLPPPALPSSRQP